MYAKPTRRGALFGAVGLAALARAGGALAWAPEPTVRPRDTRFLDRGWRFHAGDIPMPEVKGHGWSYANAKAGNAWGAASVNFDDSEWPDVRLPHDFVVSQPFDPEANLSQGYRRRGAAWYRRTLRFDPQERGRHLELEFGAAATHATVWFNGTVVDRNFSGYNGFSVDLTSFARYGDLTNSLVVRVDAEPMEGWWYEGGGLYRHVRLTSRDPLHIATDGLYADPRREADGRWHVPVEVTLANIAEHETPCEVAVELRAPDGAVIARGKASAQVAALGEARVRLDLDVAEPRLWSVASPSLYDITAVVLKRGVECDRVSQSIGFRSIRFDAAEGFFLNDVPMKIHGACVHQDHAGVGVAVPDALWAFRIRRLKSMGCNAIRISHHAPATALLDACDRLGMLVLNENRVFNPSRDYIEQLEWLVRRDRNRPCVFLWSVFNEEPMQGTEQGYEMVRRMVAVVKQLDDSRPVTAAMNDGVFTPINVSQAVDVMGFNYQQDKYDQFHAAHPEIPLISTEDTSAFQTRGAWATDRAAHVMAEDDSEAADWGATHRKAWRMIAERPFVAGAFVWTGFDYRGEPTPFDWPSASSFFGAMDLCGFAKGAYYLHRAQWVQDEPVLHILPHWTWPGREGEAIKVMAFSNAHEVELRLDGRVLERQPVDPYEMNTWFVPYKPGRLEAVAYRDGEIVAQTAVETTGAPVRVRLTPDRPRMNGDGVDVQPVTVEVLDARGRPVPVADTEIRFSITGGDILGVGNGDPNSHEPETGDRRRLFNGLAQVIVRAGEAGNAALRLRAEATGLEPAVIAVPLDKAAPPPSVPVAQPVMVIGGWRMSPVRDTAPDFDWIPSDSDQNSWQWLQPGDGLPPATTSGYVLYRVRFTPWRSIQTDGGLLDLAQASGDVEVWLDGEVVAREAAGRPLKVMLPPREGERDLVLRIRVTPDVSTGLTGVVVARPRESGG
ncbi:MAG: beta-galactosidase GalA [Brevundimonas sp.]